MTDAAWPAGKVEVHFVGGPADGRRSWVDCGVDGRPAARVHLRGDGRFVGDHDTMAPGALATYRRDPGGADGPRWLYRHISTLGT